MGSASVGVTPVMADHGPTTPVGFSVNAHPLGWATHGQRPTAASMTAFPELSRRPLPDRPVATWRARCADQPATLGQLRAGVGRRRAPAPCSHPPERVDFRLVDAGGAAPHGPVQRRTIFNPTALSGRRVQRDARCSDKRRPRSRCQRFGCTTENSLVVQLPTPRRPRPTRCSGEAPAGRVAALARAWTARRRGPPGMGCEPFRSAGQRVVAAPRNGVCPPAVRGVGPAETAPSRREPSPTRRKAEVDDDCRACRGPG